MSEETLTQCAFSIIRGRKTYIDVAWIETSLAKKGFRLVFRDLDGIYEVTHIYDTRPKSEVVAFEREFLFQRAASDIEDVPNRIKKVKK